MIQEPIDQSIRSVSAKRLQAIDSMICRTQERFEYMDPNAEPTTWYSLSLKYPDGWRCVGRRRTKLDLLEMVNRMKPEQVNGKRA